MKECQLQFLASKREGNFLENGEPEDMFYYKCPFGYTDYYCPMEYEELAVKEIPYICKEDCQEDNLPD